VYREKFVSIVKEHQRLIYKVCNTYCKDSELRKDLEQDVLEQLWKSLPRFDGRVKISTWIYQVALNTAFLFHRKESKHKANRATIDESVLTITDSSSNCVMDEKVAKLQRFIGDLDELDKALMLLYLDKNKHKDIAEILGISETNVATKISRIKVRLREYFLNN
jgi:RNA polymerase sigma factor (sigma-70 family)